MPMYGSCAGHDHARRHGPRRRARPGDHRRDRHDRPPQRLRPAGGLLRGGHGFPALGGEPFRAVFIRAPWVESVGPGRGARPVPGAADGRIVAVRQGHLLATAFHPELTGDQRVHECSSRWCARRLSRQSKEHHDRPLQVGDHQAQEGGRRRQARQALREADQEHRGGGPDRRRGRRRQPHALRRHPEGEEELGPPRQHRARRQARLGRRGRRRRLADDHVRGLRTERRGSAGRVPHRQPQPRRHRRARRDDAQRWLDGRPGLGVVPVRPQGRRDRPEGRRLTEDDVLMAVLDAGAEEVNDLGEAFEVVSEADRPGRRPHGAAGGRASTTSRPRRRSCPASGRRSTRTGAARSSG